MGPGSDDERSSAFFPRPDSARSAWSESKPLVASATSRSAQHLPTWSTPSELERQAPTRATRASHYHKTYGCLEYRYVIDPETSTWLYKWDYIDAALLVFIALIWPYETAFLDIRIDLLFALNRLADTALVVDMAMQFFIAFPDPVRPERMVKAPQSIVLHYIKGWFWFDLISVLPVDTVYLLVSNHWAGITVGERVLKAIRLMRLVRSVRLLRFWRLLERWRTSFGLSYAKLTILKLATALVLCCHWMACLLGGIALRTAGDHNWLEALKEAKGGSDDTYDNIYSLALYWAVVTITSIGYGDITPQTVLEYRCMTFCSSIMAGLWAYIIGAICGILMTLDQHEVSFRGRMDDLNWFMEDRRMPSPMRLRLRKFFVHAREMNKQRIESTVMDQMSPQLQGECAMFMHQKWISQVWYLRDMNREIIVWAARNLVMKVFAPDEEVIEDRTLFIVQRGVAALKGRVLVSGDIWGEDMLLSNPRLRDDNKARAMSHLAVLTLHIMDLFDVVVSFKEARARLRWAQIQIGVVRAVTCLATKIRAWEALTKMSYWDLNDEARGSLYRQLLQGEEEEGPGAVGSFGWTPRVRKSFTDALNDRDGTGLGVVSISTNTLRPDKALLADLAASVEEIKQSLQLPSRHASKAIDAGRHRPADPGRSSSFDARASVKSLRAQEVDLGPLPKKRPWLGPLAFAK